MQEIEYTAKLTGNRRMTETTAPKALLIMIDPNNNLDRSHCWVDLALVKHIQPPGHKRPIRISFTATKQKYLKRGADWQYTLTKFNNIKVLP